MKKKPSNNTPGSGAASDNAEFRRAVADARRIERDYVEPPSKPVAARAKFSRAEEESVLQESLAVDFESTEAGSGESLSFRRDHVSQRMLRRLARGSYAIEDELDLHGMTASEAGVELRKFIASCRSRGVGCVRIVHGKGLGSGPRGPVLKSHANAWLQRSDDVLAFVSARITDGGTGALYVLLKGRPGS